MVRKHTKLLYASLSDPKPLHASYPWLKLRGLDFCFPTPCHTCVCVLFLCWVVIEHSETDPSTGLAIHRQKDLLHCTVGESGYMYMYSWVPSLSTWNCHTIVNWLYLNTKWKFNIEKEAWSWSNIWREDEGVRYQAPWEKRLWGFI